MRAVLINSPGGVEEIGLREIETPPRSGDRVFGITAGGAQAEFVVVPESNLARIPDALDWNQAAAMPEVSITAHEHLDSNRTSGKIVLSF